MPLLLDSFFDGEIYEMSNLWQGIWFGISFIFCVLPVLTFPFAPPEFTQPHRDFWLKFLVSENWYTPNLPNVFGASSSIWTMLPILVLFALVIYLVLRNARRPQRFLLGLIGATVVCSAYLATPSRFQDPDLTFRRATIAERYYMPAGRLDSAKASAENAHDTAAIQRIRQTEWMIADAGAFAPDDWPYSSVTELPPSPSALMKQAADLQQQGKTAESVNLLRDGIGKLDFVKCELTTNLAVVLYTSGDKENALNELEGIQPLVSSVSSADCLRSQYLLGTLYKETDQPMKASAMFQSFMTNTTGTKDPQLLSFRQSVQQGGR